MAHDFKKAQCRSCGADIIWMRSMATGKNNPMDAKGEVRAIVSEVGPGNVPAVRFTTTYQSHFSSCPNADKHRKG